MLTLNNDFIRLHIALFAMLPLEQPGQDAYGIVTRDYPFNYGLDPPNLVIQPPTVPSDRRTGRSRLDRGRQRQSTGGTCFELSGGHNEPYIGGQFAEEGSHWFDETERLLKASDKQNRWESLRDAFYIGFISHQPVIKTLQTALYEAKVAALQSHIDLVQPCCSKESCSDSVMQPCSAALDVLVIDEHDQIKLKVKLWKCSRCAGVYAPSPLSLNCAPAYPQAWDLPAAKPTADPHRWLSLSMIRLAELLMIRSEGKLSMHAFAVAVYETHKANGCCYIKSFDNFRKQLFDIVMVSLVRIYILV